MDDFSKYINNVRCKRGSVMTSKRLYNSVNLRGKLSSVCSARIGKYLNNVLIIFMRCETSSNYTIYRIQPIVTEMFY